MESISELVHGWVGFLVAYKRLILFAVGVLAISSGVMWWRLEHRAMVNCGAHAALMNLEKLTHADISSEATVDGSVLFSSNDEKWNAVNAEALRAYESFSSSKLAPFFLAYRADAMMVVGKNEEARELLKTATLEMPASDLKDLYLIKSALLQLEQVDPAVIADGIEKLKKIAAKDHTPAQPVALYRLGEYFWILNDFEEARNYWGQLVLLYGRKLENQFGSLESLVWASKAESRLRLISTI